MTATVTLKCPVREVNGEQWLSLEFMGIKKLDVAAYKFQMINEQLSFAGGHRVRQTRFWDNIHLRVHEGISLDIQDVKPLEPRTSPPRRHHKGGRR